MAAKRCGYRVGIYCSEDGSPNVEYFLWERTLPAPARSPGGHPSRRSRRARRLARRSEWRTASSFTRCGISYRAARLAALTDCARPYLLAQEYEADLLRQFFDARARRSRLRFAALPDHQQRHASFVLPEKNRIGVFATPNEALESSRDFSVFEHRVNQLPQQRAAAMAGREKRLLAIYARPEVHASRNLFEIVVLALQAACERELFGPEWSFVGLGALSEIQPIALGRGHELRLYQRMTEQEYRGFVDALDIGVSLMCAPRTPASFPSSSRRRVLW